MIDNHPRKTNVRAVGKPPKNYEVVCVNDESLIVMTSDIYANRTTICQTSKVVRTNRKRRNVSTNKSTKFQKRIEANDKGVEHKCPKCNVVKIFLMDVCPACFCEIGY